jgi:hypothetical protein
MLIIKQLNLINNNKLPINKLNNNNNNNNNILPQQLKQQQPPQIAIVFK